MAKHIAGGKITGTHGTITEAALPVVRVAEELPSVKKISLGPITPGLHGGSRRNLKFGDVPSGITAIVCGSTSKQVLHIFTSDPEGTKNALGFAFYGEEWKDRPK